MKKTILICAILVCAIAIVRGASAQAPAEDDRIVLYRQLLTQANDNLVTLGAQLQAIQRENAKLKEQIAKEAPPAKSP